MNTYSRRYNCPDCGFKGRASRKRVNESGGFITCAICRFTFPADKLFRNSGHEMDVIRAMLCKVDMNEGRERMHGGKAY